ncbi:MAG: proton-conducting transporter membrane subunit, partial [Acinetobacter sp.]
CLLVIGLVTSVYGVICAIGTERLRRFVGFMVLSSVGTILVAIGMNTTAAWAGALYYMVHSTLIAAAFYILSGWITSQRGEFKDHFKIAPMMKQNKLVSIVYFIIALMMAGLPPFSGFFGKVFILQASAGSDYQMIIILTILLVSLLSILAFTRVGFMLFWRSTKPEDDLDSEDFHKYEALPSKAPPRNDRTIYLLLAGLTTYVVFAGPIYQYNYQTAAQIKNNPVYEAALLKRDAEGHFISVQPFEPGYLPETKYGGETVDPNAHLIPYVISEATLEGDNISEFKQRQIDQQYIEQTKYDDNQLKPAEGP